MQSQGNAFEKGAIQNVALKEAPPVVVEEEAATKIGDKVDIVKEEMTAKK